MSNSRSRAVITRIEIVLELTLLALGLAAVVVMLISWRNRR